MREKTDFIFHSDLLPLGIYQEIQETVITPAIPNMAEGSFRTYYGEYHKLNPTGSYTSDIRWVTPDMQMTNGDFGQTISEPDKMGNIRFGGFSRYSDINGSFQAGVVGIRFQPYIDMDTENNRWRIAIKVLNYYVHPLNPKPWDVPTKSWDCTVTIYSIPKEYGN